MSKARQISNLDPNAIVGIVPTSKLGTGTPDITKTLRGDGVWDESVLVLSAPSYILGTGYAVNTPFSFTVSSASSLSGGSINRFIVTYNGITSNVTATSNSATVTLTAPANIASSNIAISIIAVDSLGNKSRTVSKTANTTSNTAPSFSTSNVTINGASSSTWKTMQNTTNNTIVFSGVTDVEGNTPITFTITPTTGGSQYSGFSKTSGIILNESITFTAPALGSQATLSFTVVAIDSLGNVSSPVTISVLCVTDNFIPGSQGFGVAAYPTTLPSGMSALTGSADPTSSNFGNYTYSDGSIMCWIPKFYYRIGSTSSTRYATYGNNAIDIVSADTYSTEAAANTAGFALHRAFVDGGATKSGFFIDKYLASKNGATSCKSVANVAPISLTTSASYVNSSAMTGCTGILADAVVLSRSRGVGVFNVASIFMYNALAMLSLAHAQASTTTTYCAWYDATYNFPKGCNNNALRDTNDTTVIYTQATGESATNKPNTGSGSPFAKTTHNGQSCGVADLNGCIYQAVLGITAAGTSSTDTSNIANGDQYVLKHSASLANLTGGWNGSTDAWGNATGLANNYELISGFMSSPTGSGLLFGNGTNQVFSSDISTSNATASASKTNYLKTCAGYPLSTGESAGGTNLFGSDYHYHYTIANQFPVASGSWDGSTSDGVFYRRWDYYRSYGYGYVGFRSACY